MQPAWFILIILITLWLWNICHWDLLNNL